MRTGFPKAGNPRRKKFADSRLPAVGGFFQSDAVFFKKPLQSRKKCAIIGKPPKKAGNGVTLTQ